MAGLLEGDAEGGGRDFGARGLDQHVLEGIGEEGYCVRGVVIRRGRLLGGDKEVEVVAIGRRTRPRR